MKQRIVHILRTIALPGLLITFTCPVYAVFNPINPAAPYSVTNGDNAEIQSTYQASGLPTGTMASTDSTIFTIGLSAISSGTTTAITIDSNATVDYLGSGNNAATIASSRNDGNTTTDTINIYGTIKSTNATQAISLRNNNATVNDTHIINLFGGGSIKSSISTQGINAVTIALQGPGTATITGAIGLSTIGSSVLSLASGVTYITQSTLTNIGQLTIDGTSSMTINNSVYNSFINGITNNGILNVNAGIDLSANINGTIINTGTMNIGSSIGMLGGFSGSGTNVITAGSSSGITIGNSTYTVSNHKAKLTDVNTYGNMTLAQATFASPAFTAQYTGGYFPSGTYTLVTSASAISPPPTFAFTSTANSIFLNWGTPQLGNGNTRLITISATRTPYNKFANTGLTRYIGSTLENIGINNPNSNMLALLDGIEGSPNAGALTNNLQQLAPLNTAPAYSYQMHNDSMQQVKIRMAALRDRNFYFAGDAANDDNLWIRGFGGYANQNARGDSLGYYGRSKGLAIGYDGYYNKCVTLGGAVIYTLAHNKDKQNQSSNTNIKSYMGVLYGSYEFSNDYYLDGLGSLSSNHFISTRYVAFNNYSQIANGNYKNQQLSAKGIVGKNFYSSHFLLLSPEIYAQYTFTKQYKYQETGGAGTNLIVKRKNANMLQLGAGCRAAAPMEFFRHILVPDLHASGWVNAINVNQNTYFSFVDGNGQMPALFPLSRYGFLYGLGLNLEARDDLEIKVNVDFERQEAYKGYSVYLNLRYWL